MGYRFERETVEDTPGTGLAAVETQPAAPALCAPAGAAVLRPDVLLVEIAVEAVPHAASTQLTEAITMASPVLIDNLVGHRRLPGGSRIGSLAAMSAIR